MIKDISIYIPSLEVKEKVIRTAFNTLRYIRRTLKKKGFSKDLRVIAKRLTYKMLKHKSA